MADHIPFVDLDTPDEITQLLFEGTTQMLGRVPNSTRIAAHSPFIQLMFLPFGAVSQREGAGGVLTSKLKEMVIIKTSKTNGCDY